MLFLVVLGGRGEGWEAQTGVNKGGGAKVANARLTGLR